LGRAQPGRDAATSPACGKMRNILTARKQAVRRRPERLEKNKKSLAWGFVDLLFVKR
jgi:hypothetical protein